MKGLRRAGCFLIVTIAFALFGCSGQQAKELYDTARLEELQNNPVHAVQLYEQLIVRYPSSEYAVKAKERIDELKKNK
ncbi:MAG TPA: outer membrane protein assembly factor BamD [Dissulfurispiraceae bacterium]|nr:outer membrane protein assembly factor BamD [Dissulfurispiraceae bacterium]